MKNWTATHLREGNAASAPAFNREYQARIEPLAAGLDRTNLPTRCIDRPQIAANAMHKVVLHDNLAMKAALQTSNGGKGDFQCLEYDSYTGGWVTNDEWALTDVNEGMIQVEFSCWHWTYAYETQDNPKGIAYRILYNGLVLVESAPIYTHFANPRLCYTGPLKSDGTISLQWQYTSPETGLDLSTQNQAYWAGGQLLIIARWR